MTTEDEDVHSVGMNESQHRQYDRGVSVRKLRIRYVTLNMCAWDYDSETENDEEIPMQNHSEDTKGYDTTVGVQVLDHYLKAMLDSGADVSLCAYRTWKKISSLISSPQLKPVRDVVLIDYTGTRKKNVRGVVTLPLRIQDEDIYHPFFVVDGLTRDMLLGRDFLNQYQMKLNFQDGKVRLLLGEKEIVMLLQKQVTGMSTGEEGLTTAKCSFVPVGSCHDRRGDVGHDPDMRSLTPKSDCECSYDDNETHCETKIKCSCDWDQVKDATLEWSEAINVYASGFDHMRKQQDEDAKLKKIMIAQVRDNEMIDEIYGEELNRNQCHECRRVDTSASKGHSDNIEVKKGVLEEIRSVVNQVIANEGTKERLYQVLAKNSEVFVETPASVHLNADPDLPLKKHLGLEEMTDAENHPSWAEKLVMVSNKKRETIERRNKKVNSKQVDRREISVGDLVFVRNHAKSDAEAGCIKKMFYLYLGPYICIEKPSEKVVILRDPVSNMLFGKQSIENCKIWKPTQATKQTWLSLVNKKIPEQQAQLVNLNI